MNRHISNISHIYIYNIFCVLIKNHATVVYHSLKYTCTQFLSKFVFLYRKCYDCLGSNGAINKMSMRNIKNIIFKLLLLCSKLLEFFICQPLFRNASSAFRDFCKWFFTSDTDKSTPLF